MLHSKNSLLEKRRRINFIIRSAHWKFEIRALLILRDEIIRMNDALIIQILFESSLNMKSTKCYFFFKSCVIHDSNVRLSLSHSQGLWPTKQNLEAFWCGPLCLYNNWGRARKKKRKLGLERTIYLCPNPSLRDQTELRTLICDRKKLVVLLMCFP